MSAKPHRHPDLLTANDAAAYIGIARVDQLPDDFRPLPMPYNSRLYHRAALDLIIARAAKMAAGKGKLKLA